MFRRHAIHSYIHTFSSPEPTILLACGRNRELWEQSFQACAIDEDCVKPDGQNSVISFVFELFFVKKKYLLVGASGMLWAVQ